VSEILAGIYEPDADGRRPPESLYGAVKMWAHLQRQGIPVAKSTVERIKKAHGWREVTRDRRVRTTVPDPAASRAPDLVRRHFKAARPGQLHVADFTYVPLDGGGFGYSALVIDAFAGLIPGWDCSLSKQTEFVERAIRQAACYRAGQGRPFDGTAIHHSDAGSSTPQCTSLRHCCWPGWCPRSAPSAMPSTTHSPKRPWGSIRPNASGGTRRADRADYRSGRPRGLHLSLGALVQHQQAHAPTRPQTTCRGRSWVLLCSRIRPRGR